MKNTTIPERVKEPAVRGVAVQVLLLALSSLYWLSPIPLYILVGDFFIRAFIGPKLSPLAALSRWIMAPLFRFKLRMVTLRPKRFAAGIGFFMSTAALILFLYDQFLVMRLVLAVLALFSFLEAFFSFCAGCKIFALLIKSGLVKEDLCLDCVYPGGEGI